MLALPNMFTAGAGYGISWPAFSQLLFADRTRFGHHVRHSLGLGSQVGYKSVSSDLRRKPFTGYSGN